MTPASSRRRFRFAFSLRKLFVVVTIAALVSYWLAVPTIWAHQFINALAARDYATAESLFIRDVNNNGPFPGTFATAAQARNTTVRLRALTLSDIVHRQRFIILQVPWGKAMWEWRLDVGVEAAPNGLRVVSCQH